MSSRFSRKVFSIAIVTLLGMLGMGRTASATECTSDADCDTGYQCGFAATAYATGGSVAATGGSVGSSGSGTAAGGTCLSVDGTNCGSASSPPVLAVDAGAPVPYAIPDAGFPVLTSPQPTTMTGVCEPKPIVCTSVADCPSADFDCVMDMIASPTPACAPNTKCTTPAPQPSSSGTCVAKPHACNTAADCPAPLVCQATGATCSGGGAAGSDGTATTTDPTCAPGPSVCTFVPASCTVDSDCSSSLYQCLQVSASTECSGSSGACSMGDGGLVCAPAPPPVCTTTVEKDCMPKPIDCGAGQACPTGWSCFDFTNYNGGTRPVWSPNAFDKSCLPDGIILATEGHAASSGAQFNSSSGSTPTLDAPAPKSASDAGVTVVLVGPGTSTTSSTGTGAGQGGSQNPPVVNAGTGNDGTQSADAGTGTPVATQGGGCAVGGRAAGSINLWLTLACAGLVLRRFRRR